MTENEDSDASDIAVAEDDGFHPCLTQRQVDRLWAVLRSQRNAS